MDEFRFADILLFAVAALGIIIALTLTNRSNKKAAETYTEKTADTEENTTEDH